MVKKILLILLLLMVLFCITPQAIASQNPDNTTMVESNEIIIQDSISANDIENSNNDDFISENDDDDGTFSQLENLIRNNQTIDLDKDYVFNEKSAGYNKTGILIQHEITLNGNNHTINGGSGRIFNIAEGVKDVKISNLIFKNTYDDLNNSGTGILAMGGAIFNNGGLYLENCTFIDCHVNDYGGAIYNNEVANASLIVNNCNFINASVNSNGYGGGAIISFSKLKIINSKFQDCFGRFGGAIVSANETIILNCIFENNTALVSGGSIINSYGDSCEVYDSSFDGNKAQYGGALAGVIAVNCIFGNNNLASANGHNTYSGLMFNCSCENNNSNNYYQTPNSTGLSFKPGDLIFEKGGQDQVLEFFISSNPNNEAAANILLNITITDKFNQSREYILMSNEEGIVSLPLSSFNNGTFKVLVSFVNKFYNEYTGNYVLALGITNSTVSFSAGVVFEYGGSGSIYVIVDGGIVEKKNIRVRGHREANINFANKMITISGLGVGKYTLEVQSTPDENHFPVTATISVTVNKATAVIKASKLTVALKKGTVWTIKLVDSKNNKPISKMKLTLKVFTDKKFKTVTVTTNSKGIASYKTSKLSKGTHNVIVMGTHPGYSFNSLKSSIKVIKPKALKFKLKKRVNDNSGSLISYVVLDKKTKKGINGVKINILIYTGKKVKKVTLKTKKSGKYKGAMGFATNDLSVGKHKVVIVPASIKYSGSAKTTMIIKKAAKKRQTYSHKL